MIADEDFLDRIANPGVLCVVVATVLDAKMCETIGLKMM